MKTARTFAHMLASAAAVFLLGCAGWSVAAEVRVPSVEEIIDRLKAPDIKADDLQNNAVTVEGRQRTEVPPGTAPTIDLDVNFEYASAKLTPDARLVLDNLAHALADPALEQASMRVTGHTDARGTRAYNLRLSRQRAASVVEYLVRVHHIPAQRLTADGKGFDQLLDAAHPESGVNRRVQVTNIGP